jgi:hypothetical protein
VKTTPCSMRVGRRRVNQKPARRPAVCKPIRRWFLKKRSQGVAGCPGLSPRGTRIAWPPCHRPSPPVPACQRQALVTRGLPWRWLALPVSGCLGRRKNYVFAERTQSLPDLRSPHLTGVVADCHFLSHFRSPHSLFSFYASRRRKGRSAGPAGEKGCEIARGGRRRAAAVRCRKARGRGRNFKPWREK